MKENIYLAIDLKSFYASVECVQRGLDPLTTHLVVADEKRSDKTVCLAVSPPLKKLGITGRPRLFQVKEDLNMINRGRLSRNFSYDAHALQRNPQLKVGVIIVPPQMAKYVEVSAEIYGIYLEFIAPEDIHVYSIDEVFIDLTDYLSLYGLTPRQLTSQIMRTVLKQTGIPAAAGIGTNLYLAKIAMDILAKKQVPDESGLRIAYLDELLYRQKLWAHEPLTDFWQIGRGIAQRLSNHGLHSMQDIAQFSLKHKEKLYREFGINAELLIDHAWGFENCQMSDIKQYQPQMSSLSSGQVLHQPYDYRQARLIITEMADQLSLDLVAKKLVTDQISVTIRYDKRGQNADSFEKKSYGREHLELFTDSSKAIRQAALSIFDEAVNKKLFVRKLSIVAHHVTSKDEACYVYQTNLFTKKSADQLEEELEKEYAMQQAILHVRSKHGKNALIKGMNKLKDATGVQRNNQIGGHQA